MKLWCSTEQQKETLWTGLFAFGKVLGHLNLQKLKEGEANDATWRCWWFFSGAFLAWKIAQFHSVDDPTDMGSIYRKGNLD